MSQKVVAAALCLFAPSAAQQAGTVTAEESPAFGVRHCTAPDDCQVEPSALVLDANWRWVHNVGGYENCYAEGTWNEEICDDEDTCKQRCAVEGIDAKGYKENYGVHAETGSGKDLPEGVKLKFMSEGGNVGSRLYLTDGQESYKMFHLLNREFTLDVDVSTLACGMNGAVYFIEMDPQGGKGQDFNDAGAKYGTGYCDAQCPNEKFVQNETQGICCVEMDIWEANSKATAYTPHPCSTVGPTKCEGIDCGYGDNGERWQGLCDKDGCDMNAFRMGATDFYGPGSNFTVDSTQPMTVVTQFLTDDGTDEGDLVEIRRIYLQGDKVISHADSKIEGVSGYAVTDEFCSAQKQAFGDYDHHAAKDGLRNMGQALKRGMVLSLSIWDDFSTQMRWLDSTFPADQAADRLGVVRGPCDGSENHPLHVRKHHKDAFVTYSNIRYGAIGSTYDASRRLGTAVHV